jgi:phospholipid/cholesterol/gamma-HCH transport system substrate-binding protein
MNRPVSRATAPLRRRVVHLVVLMVVGALALSGCDFSVYSIPLPGGAKLGDNPYTVKVEFRDVMDLVPQSSVKVDDVTVGKVKDIQVRGGHAEVTVQLRRSVKLPDNAVAKIRQTSLLGEKFVSLSPPDTGPSVGRLGNGDVIPLSRTGRNPEVEEVLGALSLLLNGGGVAQLKTISTELNKALGGRETDVRSLLSQLKTFMGQLDTNKDQIVRAIESLNHLAVQLNKQKPAIALALDRLPRAVASINSQRDDLVKMLRALADLSSIGTKVISQSKTATIDSLRALAPTLNKIAEAGSAFPKSLQVFLTYPFVDAVVGKNPAVARNLHMGDYTNLSIHLDLNLQGLNGLCSTLPQLQGLPINICQNPALEKCVNGLLKTDPTQLNGDNAQQLLETLINKCGSALKGTLCAAAKQLPGPLSSGLSTLCNLAPAGGVKIPKLPLKVPSLSALTKCLRSGAPLGAACAKIDPVLLAQRCTQTTQRNKPKGYYSDTCKRYRRLNLGLNKNGDLVKLPIGGSGGSGGGGGGGLGGGLPGLGRAGFGPSAASRGAAVRDPHANDLTAMLVWGLMSR